MPKSARSGRGALVLLLLLAATQGSLQQLSEVARDQQPQPQQQQPPPISTAGNSTSPPPPPLSGILTTSTLTPTSTSTSTSTSASTSTSTSTVTPASTPTTTSTTPAPAPPAPEAPMVPKEQPISDSQALPQGPPGPLLEPKSIASPEAAAQINFTSAPANPEPNSPIPQALTTTTTTPSITPTTANATGDVIDKLPLLVGIKNIIDLSHPLNEATLHWPTNGGFTYSSDFDGGKQNQANESYYLKTDSFRMAVHTGTHLDAPRHFSKNGWTVDEIPLERLIDVPMTVIDLSKVVSVNRSYQFSRNDFIDLRANKSLVGPNSVVLVYTGISGDYQAGERVYFGGDTKKISEMRIPGFSEEAANYLVEMGVYGVGLDAPSADSSAQHGIDGSYDPVAHSIFNSHNIYILENINNRLSELVTVDAQATLTIAPLPITGGSGSPVRLVAVTLHSDCSMAPKSGASTSLQTIKSSSRTTIAAVLATLVAAVLMI